MAECSEIMEVLHVRESLFIMCTLVPKDLRTWAFVQKINILAGTHG